MEGAGLESGGGVRLALKIPFFLSGKDLLRSLLVTVNEKPWTEEPRCPDSATGLKTLVRS